MNDAVMPRLTSVSMVALACRRLAHAASYSGRAPQEATGSARARLTHCQPRNCAAGTIASTTTLAARGTQAARRQPSARVRDPVASSSAPSWPGIAAV